MAAAGSRTAGQHFAQPTADETHGAPTVPSVVQRSPLSLIGHCRVPHALLSQLTSHLQASRQLTLPHALAPPRQVTVHFVVGGHVMLPHASAPVQLMLQV